MSSKRVVATFAGMALAVALGGGAEAATITWYTCSAGSGCGTPSPRSGGGVNPFTFTATGGELLVTEAFEVASPVSSAPLNSIFSGGLGAGGENNPEHAVDNTNRSGNELIVFMFPEDDYTPLSYRLGWVDHDSDTQTWIGGSLGGANDVLSLFGAGDYEWGANGGGVGADSLVSMGYVQQNFSGNGSPGTYNFSNGASGRYLIISARTGYDEDDRFKIQSIVAETPSRVPEPGTVMLLGAGLALLALRRKR